MRALNPTDSAFLWMETRNQPMHVAGLNIYTPPEDAEPDYVGRLLADWGKHLSAKQPTPRAENGPVVLGRRPGV